VVTRWFFANIRKQIHAAKQNLERLRKGKLARATLLGHYIPGFLFHAANNDYDCIWLDLEHRAMSELQVQALLAYSHTFDIDVLVRPPTREKVALYRYLEDGAAGLLIPHVSTPEEAEELATAVKFPPLGERIFSAQEVTTGDNVLTLDVPSYAIAGTTYARFRVSALGGLGVGGTAADGEVEDYHLRFR